MKKTLLTVGFAIASFGAQAAGIYLDCQQPAGNSIQIWGYNAEDKDFQIQIYEKKEIWHGEVEALDGKNKGYVARITDRNHIVDSYDLSPRSGQFSYDVLADVSIEIYEYVKYSSEARLHFHKGEITGNKVYSGVGFVCSGIKNNHE